MMFSCDWNFNIKALAILGSIALMPSPSSSSSSSSFVHGGGDDSGRKANESNVKLLLKLKSQNSQSECGRL